MQNSSGSDLMGLEKLEQNGSGSNQPNLSPLQSVTAASRTWQKTGVE